MCLHDHPHPGPPQGRGHYDLAGKRWWDGDLGRWIPFSDGEDDLEVQVDVVGRPPALRRVFDTLTGTRETVTCRFVAVGHSADPRWSDFRLCGDSFELETDVDLDQLARGSAAFDLADQRLTELRAELLRCGWEPIGSGPAWWAQQFSRQRLDWPTDVVEAHDLARASDQVS